MTSANDQLLTVADILEGMIMCPSGTTLMSRKTEKSCK